MPRFWGRVLVDWSVQVGAEAFEIDCWCAGKDCHGSFGRDELPLSERLEFSDRYAVPRHDKRLAALHRAHDLASFVAQLPQCDFPRHVDRSDPQLVQESSRRKHAYALELLDLEHMLVPTDHHVGIPLNRCHEILVVVRITRNDADGAPTLYQLRDALQARQPSLDFPRREPHIPLHARVGEGTTDFVDDPNGQDEPKGFTLH